MNEYILPSIYIIISLAGGFLIYLSLKKEKKRISRLNKYIFLSLYIFLIILIWAFVSASGGFSLVINTEIWGHFGAFIGSILLAATLIYQIRVFRRQQIESKFFEMLKYYRENISEMRFINPYSISGEETMGRRVIVLIIKQYFLASNIIRSIINQGEWNENNILITDTSTDSSKNEKINNINLIISDIAYLLTFWGVSSENYLDCKKYLEYSYNKEAVDKIISSIKSIPVFYSNLYPSIKVHIDELRKSDLTKTNSIIILDNIKNNANNFSKKNTSFTKFFGGHQYHLGHYFRHLFQSVKFIDQQPSWLLSQNEKYEYIKTIRVQMSNYEQALLFINSLTQLGQNWEYNNDEGKSLISEYQLIKNLPEHFIPNLNPQNYYPNIDFELINKKENKEQIEINMNSKIKSLTNKLSFYKLILTKCRSEYLITIFGTYFISLILFLIPILKKDLSTYWWLFLIAIIILILSIKFYNSITNKIIKRDYPNVSLENKNWNHKTIKHIRKMILTTELGEKANNPDYLKFLLNAMERRGNLKIYSYPIITTVVGSLVGVLIGFYLNHLESVIKSDSEFKSLVYYLFVVSVCIISFIIFFEVLFIKKHILSLRSRKMKVIECLEEIIEEKQFNKN